jgi:hypothetical protein
MSTRPDEHHRHRDYQHEREWRGGAAHQTAHPTAGPADAEPGVVLPTGGAALARRVCRADTVASWVGWHLAELLGVGVPAVLAVTVSLWWLGVALLAGAFWLAHETRRLHRQQPSTPGSTVFEVPVVPAPRAAEPDHDTTNPTSTDLSTTEPASGQDEGGVSA